MAKQQQDDGTYEAPKAPQPAQPKPMLEFRLAWILVPAALLLAAYVLHHIRPVVTWAQIMDLLHVRNRERYTMLFHLCLGLTLVVAAVRLFGRKR